MKRSEQVRIMRERIIRSAMREFNEYDYESASINRICTAGDISKGSIYHYFSDKEELYLECLKICFNTVAQYYQERGAYENLSENGMKYHMALRVHFFKEHPEIRGLFFYSRMRPPKELKAQIEEQRADFDMRNRKFYRRYLEVVELRESVTQEEAIQHLEVMQEAFNSYFQKHMENKEDFDDLIEQHEKMILSWVDMVFYGIIKEVST